jgi:hypothetical protein
LNRFIERTDAPDEDDPKPSKLKQTYTIRDVVMQMYPELVAAENPYSPSDRQYIGSFQRSVTNAVSKLDEDNLKEVEEMLEKWNKDGAPSEVQLK